MKSVSRETLSKLALLMLEELALRKEGKIKLKYWKTYRMSVFWLGKDVTQRVVDRLVEGGYIKPDGEYIVLLKRFTPQKSLRAILKEAYNLLVSEIRQ
ncbi:hypothetical protein [Pyrobaculum islandicum]|uniref:hypothetical protein n=1 Tax=Pyrobaculum islandicum TaxID=2277 RepID=UPI0014329CBB|nr:hypothetical protein [Pyrobaculum islandicum]